MVMDASGKGMTCKSCAGLAPREPLQSKREVLQRRRYKCMDCKYNFRSSKPKKEVVCGYCGSSKIATETQMQADRLLDDGWNPL